MKNLIINSTAIFVIFLITFSACRKAEDITFNDQYESIIGTYSGTISNDNTPNAVFDATAVVTIGLDSIVQVHCYSEYFDTTIMLNTYHYSDSIMVCNTGQDFFNEYGHHQSENSNNCNEMMHNENGMMGNVENSSCEWDEHIMNDHDDGDMHYGRFSLLDNSFNYDFKMHSNGLDYFKKFRGVKQ